MRLMSSLSISFAAHSMAACNLEVRIFFFFLSKTAKLGRALLLTSRWSRLDLRFHPLPPSLLQILLSSSYLILDTIRPDLFCLFWHPSCSLQFWNTALSASLGKSDKLPFILWNAGSENSSSITALSWLKWNVWASHFIVFYYHYRIKHNFSRGILSALFTLVWSGRGYRKWRWCRTLSCASQDLAK